MPMDTNLETFRAFYEREHATTVRVLRAFPADQADMKPSEKSNSARELAWTFVLEERMLVNALRSERVMGGKFPEQPATFEAIIDVFESQHAEIQALLRDADDEIMKGKVPFPVAPKTMGEYTTSAFAWFMMLDQIHHRGQLSVYLRMADAKVPSIYGPSADEPWM